MTKPVATILEFLGSDHRACNDLFESVKADVMKKSWDSARRQFGRFLKAMLCHLAREEKILFPAVETHTANSMGPTRVMRMEHERMRRLMHDMALTVSDSDHCRYLCLSETLDMLMRQHNLKEEDLLFPMFDQMLSDERDDLIGAMEAIAR